MDSGNTSTSLQSSSGAEEEYDSRDESSSLSAFLNHQPPPLANFTTTTTNNTHLHNPLIPPQHQNTHMFNPYLDPITQTSTSIPNLDMTWSKAIRYEPNQNNFINRLIPCSSPPHNQAFVSSQRGNSSGAFPTLPQESGSQGLMLSVSAANNDQIQTHNTNTNTNNSNMVRNPKKRSRASRRAPTTVLTTDTTNFRAMVQEFTGIPAPPFTSSSFPRTRFDLFASAATTPNLRSNVNVNNHPLDPSTPPPYLLRPFAQKLQLRSLHPFPPSFSNNTLLPSTNSTTNSTSINYQQQQLSEHFGLVKHPFNTVEAYPKYPFGRTEEQQGSLEIPANLKMGVFEELGVRHDHVNIDLGCLHQNNMVSSTSVGVVALSSNGNNNINNLSNANSSTEWAQRTSTITNNDCDHGGRGRTLSSGTINYSDIAERVTNGNKVHFSGSSSDFHGEKGQDFTVTARTQGTLESWINCSSD